MDFSGLVKGVQDFWDFIWPPIFCLLALVGITYYVAPLTFGRMLSKIATLKPTDKGQIQFVKVSKRFGLDKLLPIICAFFLIFALDVLRNIVVPGGQAIPPVISYNPSALVLEHHTDSMIQCLWKTRSEAIHLQQEALIKASPKETEILAWKDPDPNHIDLRYGHFNFSDISQIVDAAVADAEVQHKDSDQVKGLHYAEQNIGTPHVIFSALKFLFIYTLILSLLELRRSPTRSRIVFRTFLLFGMIMIGLFGFFLRFLNAAEKFQDMRRYIAQTYPVAGSMHCEAFNDETATDLNSLYDKMVKREQSRGERWWSLQFPDTKVITWSWNQLKPPKRER